KCRIFREELLSSDRPPAGARTRNVDRQQGSNINFGNSSNLGGAGVQFGEDRAVQSDAAVWGPDRASILHTINMGHADQARTGLGRLEHGANRVRDVFSGETISHVCLAAKFNGLE